MVLFRYEDQPEENSDAKEKSSKSGDSKKAKWRDLSKQPWKLPLIIYYDFVLCTMENTTGLICETY